MKMHTHEIPTFNAYSIPISYSSLLFMFYPHLNSVFICLSMSYFNCKWLKVMYFADANKMYVCNYILKHYSFDLCVHKGQHKVNDVVYYT